jgi:hypothetical protein
VGDLESVGEGVGMMRVLVLGHPRSGTGYTALCFRQCGWEVGHEKVERDGISSWMWAVEANAVPWGDPRGDTLLPEVVLHVLRDPAACVSSVAYTEHGSEKWRAKWIRIPEGCGSIERAVWSIHGWSRLIESNHPTHRTKIEEVERVVSEITGAGMLPPGVHRFNARAHREISADEIKATPWVYPETAQLWDRICADYAEA